MLTMVSFCGSPMCAMWQDIKSKAAPTASSPLLTAASIRCGRPGTFLEPSHWQDLELCVECWPEPLWRFEQCSNAQLCTNRCCFAQSCAGIPQQQHAPCSTAARRLCNAGSTSIQRAPETCQGLLAAGAGTVLTGHPHRGPGKVID